jgi:nickel superoxide dismutase
MYRLTALTVVLFLAAAGTLLLGSGQPARAHCEIPCGIYDDHARIDSMLEDTTTIAKAMAQINALASHEDALSQNQLVRWVQNKEEHATRIEETIARYFLCQRVKPAPAGTPEGEAYAKKLIEHHAVMLAAMRAKQGVDPKLANALRAAIETIAPYYPAPK